MKLQASSKLISDLKFPLSLAGYAGTRTANHIESPLEVNCVCLTEGEQKVLLISLDLLYVTHGLRASVLKRIQDLGISAGQLFMGASHTHNGPAIDETKPLLGEFDGESLKSVTESVVDAILATINSETHQVKVVIAQEEIEFGINRRRRRLIRVSKRGIQFRRVDMGPNPGGEIDPVVTFIGFRNDEQLLACLWTAACHPTGQPDTSALSADYPGLVRKRLRQQFSAMDFGEHSSLPLLFFQGCSGDIRPPSGRASRWSMKNLIKRIRLGPLFHPLSNTEYEQWTSQFAEKVCQLASRCKEIRDEGTLEYSRLERSASEFAIGASDSPPVSFHGVRIGSLVVIGASAELVSGYAPLIRPLTSDFLLIPVTCIDHVIGYWPMTYMFQEGGYEVDQHCRYFMIDACRPQIESLMLGHLKRIADGLTGSVEKLS